MDSPDDAQIIDGWELANGHRHSSEEPEATAVALNAKLTLVIERDQLNDDRSAAIAEKLMPAATAADDDDDRCRYCRKLCKFTKILPCQCRACFDCALAAISHYEDPDIGGQTACGRCGKSVEDMPARVACMNAAFAPNSLSCMTCKMAKDPSDGWWCHDCSKILCSKCAHKKHRDHNTVEFELGKESASYCLSMFDAEKRDVSAKLKTIIWMKFEEMFGQLENVVDAALDVQNKQRRLRLVDIFGDCTGTAQGQQDTAQERLCKRLSITRQRAVAQFPYVLDTMLELADMESERQTVKLQPDVVTQQVVELFKQLAKNTTVDDFSLRSTQNMSEEAAESIESTEPKNSDTFSMTIGNPDEKRHY